MTTWRPPIHWICQPTSIKSTSNRICLKKKAAMESGLLDPIIWKLWLGTNWVSKMMCWILDTTQTTITIRKKKKMTVSKPSTISRSTCKSSRWITPYLLYRRESTPMPWKKCMITSSSRDTAPSKNSSTTRLGLQTRSLLFKHMKVFSTRREAERRKFSMARDSRSTRRIGHHRATGTNSSPKNSQRSSIEIGWHSNLMIPTQFTCKPFRIRTCIDYLFTYKY